MGDDKTIYRAVVNHEGQYSVWPEDRPIPHGWREAAKRGLKEEVLRHIGEIWTDLRPLSVRSKMENLQKAGSFHPE